MAGRGSLESILGPLPTALKQVFLDYTRAWVGRLRFGAPGSAATPCEDMGGSLVPFTTSGTANGEVAIAHRLDRVPRLWFPVLSGTTSATIPALTVTQAPDSTYLYVSSPSTSAAGWLYVE